MSTEPVSQTSEPNNDWDHHWDAYGEQAMDNPVNHYRRRLILSLLGNPPAGSTMVDIGSGQGQFAVSYAKEHPSLDIWGVEYSAAGVAKSQALAAAEGVTARFRQVDLLQPTQLAEGQAPATFALCSEVLEHVDDPTTLIRNARVLLAPGCRLVVTVPGGPRSAFDHHIGHYQHFTAAKLRQVLTEGGYDVKRVLRAGFPTFNLYKLAIIARGKRLISDIENRSAEQPKIKGEGLWKPMFNFGFRYTLDSSPFGWQMAAVAEVPR
jgi:2-polyprenyl-3-methyl-5-hydroxy-6-metoxy-1,4-benzoquinol methylase